MAKPLQFYVIKLFTFENAYKLLKLGSGLQNWSKDLVSLSLGKAGSLVIVIQEPTAVINAKQEKREIGPTIDIVKALLNTLINLNVEIDCRTSFFIKIALQSIFIFGNVILINNWTKLKQEKTYSTQMVSNQKIDTFPLKKKQFQAFRMQ